MEFLVDHVNVTELALVRLVNVSEIFNDTVFFMKIVDEINENVVTIPTSEIEKPCIYLETNADNYISAVPNILHY